MQKLLLLPLLILCYGIYGQGFAAKESSIFLPQKKKVILYENQNSQKLILFRTDLQVNTDGVPTSYHPFDLRGTTKAMNTILNAVAIYRLSDKVKISIPPAKYSKKERDKMTAEAYHVFEQWRDGGYSSKYPDGYEIRWQNVLIAKDGKPCIFQKGEYAGYFASATSLKNNLNNKGECECDDQVNPLKVPTLVLVGGKSNVLKDFGAEVGDLLVAYNTDSKKLVYAIIGDKGPEHNLGEGSVILNMKLLAKTQYPRVRADTYGLAITNNPMICIIPASRGYKLQKTYSQENIQSRIAAWFATQGITEEKEIIQFLEQNKGRF